MILRSDKYLSLQFLDDNISMIEMEHDGDEFVMTAIDTLRSTMDYSNEPEKQTLTNEAFVGTMMSDLKTLFSRTRPSAKKVACSIDSQALFITSMPTDNSLDRHELNEHITWELGVHFEGEDPKNFITDLVTLEELPEQGIHDKLMITIRREHVAALKKILGSFGLSLNIVDVDHFGAGYALRLNYPEITHHTIAFLGMKKMCFDFTVLHKGHTVAYSSSDFSSPADAASQISALLSAQQQKKISKIYVHGPVIGTELLRSFRDQLTIPFDVMDAFKKIRFGKQIREGPKYRRLAYQFAPCVGMALRKE
jgi:Tfp pilus assembly PilM family ATPase